MAACDIATPLRHTTQYHTEYPNALDLRNQIHPKLDFKKDCFFIPQSYRQVFGWDKAFVPNLSILDLLFNKGPESLLVLRDRKSTRLNSSHVRISYAVFCLKKKKKK